MKNGHTITNVIKGSIAEEMEIRAGFRLLSVNGKPIEYIFDYRFLIDDTYVELEIEDSEGEVCIYEIEKDYDEDPGLEFGSGLMDEYHSCTNRCIFCFIDQMPPGMRDTLYFKDDDSRLSFLQGNYVTLTNMKSKDIDRLIAYRMEPINISVHTTDPELRCKMLHNRFAGQVLSYIDRLFTAGIRMNGQIVLCKGINDGLQLEKTIQDLSSYIPCMESVSVVPVGLTRFRDGLFPLEPFNKVDAKAVIECVEKWQEKLYNTYGIHFIHASDEFYLLAGMNMPEEERYDGYLQLENGVGMIRLLFEEFMQAVDTRINNNSMELKAGSPRSITVATGMSAAPFIQRLCNYATDKLQQTGTSGCTDLTIKVQPITNRFFGENITVSGLICGKDIIDQLRNQPLGDALLLPVNMFRAGEEYFLDDVTKQEVENTLHIPIVITPRSGEGLLSAILGYDVNDYSRQIYER